MHLTDDCSHYFPNREVIAGDVLRFNVSGTVVSQKR